MKPHRTQIEKKSSQTGKNPSQTGLNRFCPKNKPNQIETGWFEPVSVFLKKIQFSFFFL
jgi:hypothetical protein